MLVFVHNKVTQITIWKQKTNFCVCNFLGRYMLIQIRNTEKEIIIKLKTFGIQKSAQEKTLKLSSLS